MGAQTALLVDDTGRSVSRAARRRLGGMPKPKPPKDWETFDYYMFHPDGDAWMRRKMRQALAVCVGCLALIGFLL